MSRFRLESPAEAVDLARYPLHPLVPRHMALFAYHTQPDTDSSGLFKLVRYGRSETLTPPRS